LRGPELMLGRLPGAGGHPAPRRRIGKIRPKKSPNGIILKAKKFRLIGRAPLPSSF
jgi:hypothetical protein